MFNSEQPNLEQMKNNAGIMNIGGLLGVAIGGAARDYYLLMVGIALILASISMAIRGLEGCNSSKDAVSDEGEPTS